MKTFLRKLAFALMFCAVTILAQASVVTLGVSPTKTSDSISIGTNEVATIVTFHSTSQGGPSLNIIAAGVTNIIGAQSVITLGSARLVAGPATIQLKYNNNLDTAFCTVQIDPESFPPDKTLIIPADTKGANIIMEASPDLVHWTNSVPGLYTNTTGNLFFRIRADRIP